ncbi:MAG: hypothetical protein H7Z41_03970 [Cytophagales bacterium]|nr:hypothetical protein [Armatimonadota bacterium]
MTTPSPRRIHGKGAREALLLLGILGISILCLSIAAASTRPYAGAQDATSETAPRIAIWNPGGDITGPRFRLSSTFLRQTAERLRTAGVRAELLTAEEIRDPARFSAGRFDALMLEGSALPEANIPAYQKFLDDGGVLIALAADNPFEIKIAPGSNSGWRLSPESPPFAWQTHALYESLGMVYHTERDFSASGVTHTPSSLLKKYVPGVKPFTKILTNRWYVPDMLSGSKFYPLVRSQMADGRDYTPQMYLVANGKRHAILCASALFTTGQDTTAWPLGTETLTGIARLAQDLRRGAVSLDGNLTVTPPGRTTPAPLLLRTPTGSIEPEQARPIIRWGRFDGARGELGPLHENKGVARKVTMTGAGSRTPGGLAPGTAMCLALPALNGGGGPLYLRVRGAYVASGATLTARMGNVTIWSEAFVYRNPEGTVNLGGGYGGVPAEFTRIIFLPPSSFGAKSLMLTNSGTAPLYFDALQIEQRTRPATRRGIGLHTGVELAYDRATALTPERLRNLSYLRATARPWWVGPPGDPKRWDRFDHHVARYTALHDHLQLILEGTPEWAATSSRRFREGGARGHMTPPDTAKYRELTTQIIAKYAGKVDAWEIWNEANITQFWQGTPEEYAALVNALAPVIRERAPESTLIVGGASGTTTRLVDPFIIALSESGALQKADLLAFHAYANNGGWDVAYGLFEGHVLSIGSAIEIYCNEQGYFWKNGGTPEQQLVETNIALSRLLANGVAKVTLFNAGGDSNDLGLIDQNGVPRAAYAVLEDYLLLVKNGSRRLDLSLTAADNTPLSGIYSAASSHDDGSITLVLNPADATTLPRRVVVRFPVATGAHYTVRAGNLKLPILIRTQKGQAWAEVTVTVSRRMVVHVE